MTNNLYLICGLSGSGKTSVVNMLRDEYGYAPVESYTTRPRRSEEEGGHTFVTEEEFHNLKDMVAYTKFNGYEYGVTEDMLEKADTYVIDVDGIKYLKEHYHGTRPLIVIVLDVMPDICMMRMLMRGDSFEKALERMNNDAVAFQDMYEVANHIVDGNETVEESVEEILEIIKSYEEGGE